MLCTYNIQKAEKRTTSGEEEEKRAKHEAQSEAKIN
jgi:hypothetical protein